MPWTRVIGVGNTWWDIPHSSILIGLIDPVPRGSIVVVGIMSTPRPTAYVVTDNALHGTFTWIPAGDFGFASFTAGVSLFWSRAAHNVTGPVITVTPSPATLVSIALFAAVYQPPGVAFVDQASSGRGTGTAIQTGLTTPTNPNELAIAFGASLGAHGPLSADAPLSVKSVITTSPIMTVCWADSLSVNAPLTPTMHLASSGDWGIVASVWDAAPAPPSNPPGSFLGSGLEPFPIRRMPERRYEYLYQYRRDRLGRHLIK